jgi:hypothetical protein
MSVLLGMSLAEVGVAKIAEWVLPSLLAIVVIFLSQSYFLDKKLDDNRKEIKELLDVAFKGLSSELDKRSVFLQDQVTQDAEKLETLDKEFASIKAALDMHRQYTAERITAVEAANSQRAMMIESRLDELNAAMRSLFSEVLSRMDKAQEVATATQVKIAEHCAQDEMKKELQAKNVKKTAAACLTQKQRHV